MESYPTPAQAAVIHAAEKFMEETMARYDPSHDAYHVRRVRRTALSLARSFQAQNPDLLVVEVAALLHDVLDKKYVTPEAASDPYAFFLPFFQSVSEHVDLVTSGQGLLIAKIIDNVSWTTEKRLRGSGEWGDWHESCVELHCVQDADRLDAIGAFGIMRCAAYSAVVNRPLHVPDNDPQSTESAIGHFHDKLLHIRDRLKTQPGKALGEKRHKLMLDFLKAVDEEYSVNA
ncbi:hypothetical protein BD410DRAFT_813408 [Rickenella mellea]|uniref:HD/PDEase domain-containing protein n=1 Tax=Rickenella mellea TaxID=50990 RepID=A0A4Y7QDA0_9AGAM|nr:hypothetical protein BD410DRAFT_813408 [Rickenella mellea]